jgi:hypothetical protein
VFALEQFHSFPETGTLFERPMAGRRQMLLKMRSRRVGQGDTGSAADWSLTSARPRNVSEREGRREMCALRVRLRGSARPYWLTTSVAVPTLSAVNVPWATKTPTWS